MGSPKRLPKITLLRRRRDYLRREIDHWAPGKALAWDKAELAAIEWAIKIIEDQGLSDERNHSTNS